VRAVNLALLESRRAVARVACAAPWHSRGLYGVRLVGCGATDQVRRTPKEQIAFQIWVHLLSSGQTA
jgi:hypothetical protein